jgi:hypothetical protein
MHLHEKIGLHHPLKHDDVGFPPESKPRTINVHMMWRPQDITAPYQ